MTIAAAVADPSRVLTRAIDRVAYASDASHYLFTPRSVVIAKDAAEVGRILLAATRAQTPVTFRSGGTSLSGQASTDQVLIDVRRSFRRIDILDNGLRVRVEPGATVRQVNARLARFGRKLGPDPASDIACTIGGVVNNNSSGMACGTLENTYRTLDSLVFVLPSGTRVDTAAPDADSALATAEPELVAGLERLLRRVRSNPASVSLIERSFSMKNTMGYGINSFLDFDSPADLLAHLIIGSEGTLAFVAEATYRTVPLYPHTATGLAIFPDLESATSALPDLVATGAATLELMDSTSIRVGQGFADAPTAIKNLQVADHAALLVEFQANDAETCTERAHAGADVLARANLVAPVALTTDTVDRAAAWKLRKGLYASVAGARPSGTTALLEDIVVPVSKLAATCGSLQEMFAQYAYRDSVIFGHAKDGNIHFMLTDGFTTDAQLTNLAGFTDDLVDLVLAAGGNLKAEHGTGRAMAPYVRRQYGAELYDVMCELKRLCDPANILNPGVIIDDDPGAHLAHIKAPVLIEVEADRCVECGYCEPVCPSKDLTLTPRQRIVTRRAMARAEASGDHAFVRELEDDYDYAGVETCAVDGMCQTACPVLINTGDLVKRLRREQKAPAKDLAWTAAAHVWGSATRGGALALSVASRVPATAITSVTDLGRTVLGTDTVPRFDGGLPGGGPARRALRPSIGAGNIVGVFVPACVNSMFGAEGDGIGVTAAFTRLVERAGVSLLVPEGVESLCCGTPWSSKGMAAGHEVMRERVILAMREATRGGELPFVTDASSCTEGFAQILKDAGIETEDAVAFTERVLLPRLDVAAPTLNTLALHPTCSSTQLGIDPALRTIAERVAERVEVPDSWGCCAFAGDRGMLHPELTASATAAEARDVRALKAEAHASCNRTCEIGMTRATGTPYRHILELLEKATRP